MSRHELLGRSKGLSTRHIELACRCYTGKISRYCTSGPKYVRGCHGPIGNWLLL